MKASFWCAVLAWIFAVGSPAWAEEASAPAMAQDAARGGATAPAEEARVCGDDPRLADLPRMLKNGEMPAAPLMLTPESFLRLNPAIRKALGQIPAVCPGVPLNSAGRPMMRLKLPFPEIWEVLEMAVNADDWEDVAFVRDSVTPLPMPPEALFSLLEVPVWTEATMKKLAAALRITPSIEGWRFFALDVFHALGGRAAAPARVGWAENFEDLARARAKAAALNRQAILLPYSGQFRKEARQSLAPCGVDAVPVKDFF